MNWLSLWNSLAGSRTHLVCLAYLIVTLAGATGLIDGESTRVTQNLLIGLGGVTLRAAIANLGQWLDRPNQDSSNDPPPTFPRIAALIALLTLAISAEMTLAQEATRQRVCDGRRCYFVDVPTAQTPSTARPAPLPAAPAVALEVPTSMKLSPATRAWYRNPDGSCVQCSIGMCGVHTNDRNAASLLWDTEFGKAERGGSWPSRVEAYCDRRGIRAWSVTGESIDDTLPWCEWAAKTGRFAAIGAGAAHFQTLYGYDPATREWLVCNNNSTDRIDRYDEAAFRRLHAASGPWVVVLQKPSSDPPRPIVWWR